MKKKESKGKCFVSIFFFSYILVRYTKYWINLFLLIEGKKKTNIYKTRLPFFLSHSHSHSLSCIYIEEYNKKNSMKKKVTLVIHFLSKPFTKHHINKRYCKEFSSFIHYFKGLKYFMICL